MLYELWVLIYGTQSEEYYGGDISLIMNYQERSVLGKRKASVDSAASPESLPPAPKRIFTKTDLPEESCSSSPTFPSPPGPPLLIVSCTRNDYFYTTDDF